jgi:hypothetical protein
VAELAEQAATLRDRFTARAESIEANGDLSDEARARMLEEARAATNEQIRVLHDQVVGGWESERQQLEKDILGPPPAPMWDGPTDRIARDASYRDALDRVVRTEDSDALARLHRTAALVGDYLQERAAMAIALEAGHADIVNAYIEAHPGDGPKIERLWELRSRRLVDDVRVAMHFVGV